MRFMNEFIKSAPYDLLELHLVHLVAKLGSFTQAGIVAGLSQSAITRQIQGIEDRLGLILFKRTTRKVVTTPAGEFLLRETAHVLGDVAAANRRLHEEFANAPKIVRTGISRTIGLAYLPGFFFANRRHQPGAEITVTHESSRRILEMLESDALDVGILCPPNTLPQGLQATHRFRDEFVLITPENILPPKGKTAESWRKWTAVQSWLLIQGESQTGLRLRRWINRQKWKARASMEMDSFDSIIQLVALGMGVSLVPHRALALYARKRGLRRHPIPNRFSRELAVVSRRSPHPPGHVTEFVRNILF